MRVKKTSLGLVVTGLAVGLSFIAIRFVLLPYIYNQKEYKERQIIENINSNIKNVQAVYNVIDLESVVIGNYGDDAEVPGMRKEISGLVDDRKGLVEKLNHQVNASWWISLMPSKYQNYEAKKRESFLCLNKYNTKTININDIQNQVDKLVSTITQYDKNILVTGKEDLDTSVAKANEIKAEGKSIAALSSAYLKQGIITKNLDDYIQVTVNVKNKMITNSISNFTVSDQKKQNSFISEINEIYKKRENILNLNTEWNQSIIIPKEKIIDQDREICIDKAEDAYKFYQDNYLSSDPLSKLLKIDTKLRSLESDIPIDHILEETKADLDGDGQQDIFHMFSNSNEMIKTRVNLSLVAYNDRKEEIGRLTNSQDLKLLYANILRVITPYAKSKIQFVGLESAVGDHSSLTLLFTLLKDKKEIVPLCHSKTVTSIKDCAFWSGNITELVIDDIDGDGTIEVVEIVDEYPKDGVLTSAEKKLINDSVKESSLEVKEDLMRVQVREAGGRGSKVVWSVYKLNNNYFEIQTDKNYDKYFDLAEKFLKTNKPSFDKVIKRSAISKDSIDFNLFLQTRYRDNY